MHYVFIQEFIEINWYIINFYYLLAKLNYFKIAINCLQEKILNFMAEFIILKIIFILEPLGN